MQENTSLIVFIQFFAVLERSLKRDYMSAYNELDVRQFFLSKLSSLGMRSTERNIVVEYMKNPVGVLNIGLRPSDEYLKKYIQSIYIQLCEQIGPVETDSLFGNTLASVSKSRAAKHYPPEQFL